MFICKEATSTRNKHHYTLFVIWWDSQSTKLSKKILTLLFQRWRAWGMNSFCIFHWDFKLHLSRELISRHHDAGNTNQSGVSLANRETIWENSHHWNPSQVLTLLLSSRLLSCHTFTAFSQTPFGFINSSVNHLLSSTWLQDHVKAWNSCFFMKTISKRIWILMLKSPHHHCVSPSTSLVQDA